MNDLQKLVVPNGNEYNLVDYKDIIMLKAENTYTHVYVECEKKPWIISKPLKYCEEELKGGLFIRVNQSYIVNIMKIKKYVRGDGTYLLLDNSTTVSVTPTYKDEVKKRLGIKK